MSLLNGCGSSAPKLSEAEQAEVEPYVQLFGKAAILAYLDESKSNSDVRYLQYLISKGADVNAKGKNNDTPFEIASEFGTVDVVKFLVSKGAEVNANNTATLFRAARNDNVEVAKFLVSKGADVNAKNFSKYTPLHLATQKGNVDVVKFLVSKGADVNAKNDQEDVPLHYARQVDLVEFLISKGADVDAKDSEKSTPLHNAVRRWADVYTQGTDRENCIDVIRYLVSKGADPNAQAEGYSAGTPLGLAERANVPEKAEIVRILSGGK